LRLTAEIDLDGERLDEAQGPPVRVNVSADPAWLLGPGARSLSLDALPGEVEVTLGRAGDGVLTVDVVAATCHDDVCTFRRNTRHHSLHVS
jgi:hypothetical protein